MKTSKITHRSEVCRGQWPPNQTSCNMAANQLAPWNSWSARIGTHASTHHFAYHATRQQRVFSELGICSSVFWANRSLFAKKWANERFAQKNERFAHGRSFLVSDLSESLIFGEWPERFAHIANFWWAIWANRSVAHLIWAKWVNEWMSTMSKWANSQPCVFLHFTMTSPFHVPHRHFPNVSTMFSPHHNFSGVKFV